MTTCGEVRILPAGDAAFERTVAKLLAPSTFDSQCYRKDGRGIDLEYVKRYVRPRADFVAVIDRPCPGSDANAKQGKGACFCGFGFGYVKRHDASPGAEQGGDLTIVYVDLVCTQHKKGKVLLEAMEDYGKARGAAMSALRAAERELIPIYARYGYRRIANACLPPSRAQRAALRECDRFAVSVKGLGREKVRYRKEGAPPIRTIAAAWKAEGYARPRDRPRRLPYGWSREQDPARVFTDGVRVAMTADEAWRRSGQERRPHSSSDLPDGWRAEEGNHGWWMAKCLL